MTKALKAKTNSAEVAPSIGEQAHKPTASQSYRDRLLDMLAMRAANRQRLPLKITINDLEVPTEDFLATFANDRRESGPALQRIAPQAIAGIPQVNESASVLRFMLDDQKARSAATRAKQAKPALTESAAH